jgi:hypothetical protein
MIERDEQAVSDLRTLSNTGKLTPPAKERIWAQMEKVWAKMPQVPDSARIIEADRSR